MAQVVLGDHEQIESALRRSKRQVARAAMVSDMRKDRHFESTTEQRKRKDSARRRERQKLRGRRP